VAPAPLQGAAVDPGTGGGGGSVPPRSRGSRSGSGEAAGVGAVRRRLNPRREKEEEEENGWAGRLRGRVWGLGAAARGTQFLHLPTRFNG
jgi:hypothetical protein